MVWAIKTFNAGREGPRGNWRGNWLCGPFTRVRSVRRSRPALMDRVAPHYFNPPLFIRPPLSPSGWRELGLITLHNHTRFGSLTPTLAGSQALCLSHINPSVRSWMSCECILPKELYSFPLNPSCPSTTVADSKDTAAAEAAVDVRLGVTVVGPHFIPKSPTYQLHEKSSFLVFSHLQAARYYLALFIHIRTLENPKDFSL